MIESALTARATDLRVAGDSDPGRIRSNNEDRVYFDAEQGIFLVVDGVGGRAAGEIAASIAVDVIVDRLERRAGTPERRVREAIAAANNEIFNRAQQSVEYAGMTCVVTVALLTEHHLTIGHVGDSRLYKITPTGIVKMTHDHSPVGEQEDSQEISEVDAMHHPRRNEVFRDVGSARHGPDDPEFIEVVHTRFDPSSAILLCSDGLSDMVSSSAIERTVRHCAGDPDMVVRALIDAANDAGGRDNVSVLYVEGPEFTGVRAQGVVADARGGGRAPAGIPPADDDAKPHASRTRRAMRAVVRSRAVWMVVGVVAGLALAVAAILVPDALPITWRGRVLVVGGENGHTSIAAAMAIARPRDIIQVEPGEYAEAIDLKPGVHLAARVPGSVVLVAPDGQPEWVCVTASGGASAITGIRILGRPGAPVAVGMRLDGNDVVLDDATFGGNIDVAVDVRSQGSVLIRSSRFTDVRGLPLRVGPSAHPTVRQNVFVRGVDAQGPAVHVLDNADPTLMANLFIGYSDAIGASPARRQQLLQGNYVLRGSDHVGR